ncbi:MAG: 3-phosphoshikimate 1-carboxyvinyltransferase [Xanthomonadales bacterium]|nr:3-phosphoshikimate 1-carboxyvinyltransferase [Xanthomonadales bacterium]
MAVFEVMPGGCLKGRVVVPGDKSVSHRSVMLGALAEGLTTVEGFLPGADTLNTAAIFEQLGVRIERLSNTRLRIHGVGLHGLQPPTAALDCGNAGTAMRLLCGLLAAQRFGCTLVGDESLSRRPMRRVLDPLAQMGADIRATPAGTAPLAIHPAAAGLRGIDYTPPVASAQVKSALLFAGLYADGPTMVREPEATRDYTEQMLRGYGAELRTEGKVVTVQPQRTPLQAMPIIVPGDFSSAAFFLVGAAIAPGSDLIVANVGLHPRRTGLLACLLDMGADIEVLDRRWVAGNEVGDLRVRHRPLRGIEVPVERVPDMIDEFPAFLIAAALAEGRTLVTGAAELRVKESDRLAAMAAGLRLAGVPLSEQPDGIELEGQPELNFTAELQSHTDHRIAMAFAMAALRASTPLRIAEVDNVATSFPGFDALAASVGLGIRRR